MRPTIEKSGSLELSPPIEELLANMFAGYRRIIINKEFGGGLSGGYILEVQPIKTDGAPELPIIVKLATISLIQKEWEAYRQHIRYRLPYAAQVRDEPFLFPETGWGGLRYTLMGGSTFEVISLRDYCRQANTTPKEACAVLERLLRIMRHIWQYHYISPKFLVRASYDRLLPVNLLIQDKPGLVEGQPYLLSPDHLPAEPLRVGDRVAISGFAVHKTNRDTRTITLNRPESTLEIPSYYLRWKSASAETIATYQVNQIIDSFEGEVIETRAGQLHHEIRQLLGDSFEPSAQTISYAGEISLPNPLQALEIFLNQPRQVRIASIHGDFHLENMLIEPETGLISLIDFADAREDHILHDFLRLETEIMTRFLPEILFRHNLPLIQTLVSFYWQLHCTDFKGVEGQPNLPHPDLEKPWSMLVMLRQAAREYFLEADDSTEYYQGLALYLLGALKFKNLNTMPEAPLPKRVALWAAALIYLFLTTPARDLNTPPAPLASLLSAQPQRGVIPTETVLNQNSEALISAEAARRLAALPLDVVPTLAPLPPQSRMPLRRNPLFIGRQRDLKAVARTLKGGELVAVGQVETAATTGLGGIGKTQLACEFVHRYGQFFAGGVFWLSFADPKAVPAEVAACGRRGALALRADFEDRPLEEQVQLVMAAWQSPLPRLLIFDNCEDPELLAQWRPANGGCRILVTSRRANWKAALGVQMLPLDVLSRWESIALLREHQPDANNEILDAIAKELGDLPLALHLAGSYMALYRRAITPAQYLEQLQDPVLLEHRSLKGKGASPTEHSQNIRRAIALSYEQLDPNHEIDHLALKTLAHAACFAPGEPIPCHLLELSLNLAKEEPGAPLKVEEATTRLVELGLLRAETEDRVRLHRLVVAFVRDVNREESLESAEAAVETAMIEEAGRINQKGYPAPLLAWQPHLRAAAKVAQARGDELGAKLGAVVAEHLRQAGDYRGAQLYLEAGVTIWRQLLGNDHPVTARNLADLGHLFDRLEDLEMAWSCFEQALAIQLESQGERHADTATTINYMGFLLQNKGELAEARKYHERALDIRESVLGAEHPESAESRINLAFIHYAHQEWAEARQNLEKVRTVYRRMLGEEHPKTISVLEHLGELAQAQNDLAEAQKIFVQVLDVRRRVLGETHPETSRTLDYLGVTCHQQGNLAKAQDYYKQALQIRRLALGEDNLLTAESWSNLGALASDIDDLETACQYYEKALRIFEARLGPAHAQTWAVRQKLASLSKRS